MINLNTLYQFLTTTAKDVIFVSWGTNPIKEYFKQQGWGENLSLGSIWGYLPREIKYFYIDWLTRPPMCGRHIAQELKRFEQYAD